MSKNIIDVDGEKMTEEEFDEKLNNSYQVGISSGLSRAATIMIAKATAYFEVGQDELAHRYRDISKEFKKLAEQEHPNKEKKV
jgi:hypothetical protein